VHFPLIKLFGENKEIAIPVNANAMAIDPMITITKLCIKPIVYEYLDVLLTFNQPTAKNTRKLTAIVAIITPRIT